MGRTTIEWCDFTFNPWVGCTKISAGCKNCYAESLDNRWKSTPEGWGTGKPRKRTSEANWRKPYSWDRKAEKDGVRYKVFCASLADVFDEEVSDDWRIDLFNMIGECKNLDWLLLTKRPQKAMSFLSSLDESQPHDDWMDNIWLGVSVENQEAANERIPLLLQIPARVRFLSCEPLLGPVTLDLRRRWVGYGCPDGCLESELCVAPDGALRCGICSRPPGGDPKSPIDWVIVGGESGGKARRMDPDWVRSLRVQCVKEEVPFFFKQWGTFDENGVRCGKKAAGRELDGRLWNEFPEVE